MLHIPRVRSVSLLLALVLGVIPVVAAAQTASSVKDGKSAAPAQAIELPALAGKGAVSCVGGQAGQNACMNTELLAFMPKADLGAAQGIRLNEVWGWEDPQTGARYALVGRMDGVAFVDVTDAGNPRYVGELPMTAGQQPRTWRDMKVYRNHMYVVADASDGHGMQVFNLERLRDVAAGAPPVTFDVDALFTGNSDAHNVAINEESGFAYLVGGNSATCDLGLQVVDLSDPAAPVNAGCFRDRSSRRGYVHDTQCVIYGGPDRRFSGSEICFSSNENAVVIADVTDKTAMTELSAGEYPGSGYIHQGWLTEDHRYFVQDDELDERAFEVPTTTRIWDVTDLTDPVLASVYTSSLPVIDHNLYVVGDRVYQSNYTGGLRVLDISDINRPKEVAYFDTFFPDDFRNFNGSWGNYPFFEEGLVLVGDRDIGLFIVRVTEAALASLGDVSLSLNDRSAEVTWQAAGLDHVDRFRIEVGTDAPGSSRVAAEIPGGGALSYSAVAEDLEIGNNRITISIVGKDGSSRVAATEEVYVIPDAFLITGPAPHPFSSSTVMTLAVRERQRVKIGLYDASGREVLRVMDDRIEAGVEVPLRLNAADAGLSSGIYFLRLNGETFSETRELVVVK